MGQDGERRKTYSAAVIDGFKRNSTIYVGDSIVRKTDTILSNGKDVVCVCIIYSYNNEGTIGYRNSNTNIRKKRRSN